MSLFFEEEGQPLPDLECEQLAEKVITAALDYEGCPYECEIELLLTDDETIRGFNQQYRRIDRSTDVLSFPLVDFAEPGAFDWLEERIEYFNPDSGELALGNIIISTDRVVGQAREYGHSIEREYAFLIVHSVLHLLGYDHLTDAERLVMEDKQKSILNKLNILR